jgi:hypothetical protein
MGELFGCPQEQLFLNVPGLLRMSMDNNSQQQPARTDWMDGIPRF